MPTVPVVLLLLLGHMNPIMLVSITIAWTCGSYYASSSTDCLAVIHCLAFSVPLEGTFDKVKSFSCPSKIRLLLLI